MAITQADNTIQQQQAILQRYNVPQNIAHAIQSASRRTGVDFAYLVEKAAAESSFKPNIKAKTSSATGLYQFIDSTWLQTVKKHGAEHGLKQYADAICVKNGKFCVDDPLLREKIMDARKDPRIAALMAAEFAGDNQKVLQNSLGNTNIGNTDLYLAHFMGAGGASKFLQERRENGNQVAATLFPAAAKANRNVFYGQNGKARSLNEVYAFFDKKFSEEMPVLAQNSTESLDAAPVSPSYPNVFKKSHQQGASMHQRSWDSLLGKMADITKQDELLQDRMMGGGLLAPQTTMYMAVMNIFDNPDEESGASLWLDNDKNKGQNTPYEQKFAKYGGF